MRCHHNIKRAQLTWRAEMNTHYDVIKWKHFPCYWPLCGEFTGPDKVNNREAGDLTRHRGHFDVSVMYFLVLSGAGWSNGKQIKQTPYAASRR